jgi:WhiB family redox-sensing transcriptional regulator
LADEWAWQERAACRDVNPDLFFAPEEERGMRRRARELVALSLCGTCPVQAECRRQAEAFGDTYGVWGGTTEHQRELLARSTGTSTASTGRRRVLQPVGSAR